MASFPVYSTNFGRAPGFTGGPSTLFTVSTGLIAVVKCMSIVWGNIIGSGFDGWFMDDSGAKIARYAWAVTSEDPFNYGGTMVYYGNWVFNEGESIEIQTVAGTGDFSCSGYLFSAVP